MGFSVKEGKPPSPEANHLLPEVVLFSSSRVTSYAQKIHSTLLKKEKRGRALSVRSPYHSRRAIRSN